MKITSLLLKKNTSVSLSEYKGTFYLLTIMVAAIIATGCVGKPRNSMATHDSSKWESDIRSFESMDRTNMPSHGCIVFSGSSSIRFWTNLASDFPGLPVINRGFGGCQLADVCNFADRIIIPYAPREVVIYCGCNDVDAKKPVDVVYGDFVELMTRLRTNLPTSRLVYIANAPNPKRWSETAEFQRLNTLTQNYCRKHDIGFVDVFPLMLAPDGLPKPDIYREDRLHMNEKGYAIWVKAVRPFLN
jgi:lysophospholipase L1-like esterase